MTVIEAIQWLAIIAAHALVLVAAWKLTSKTETHFARYMKASGAVRKV